MTSYTVKGDTNMANGNGHVTLKLFSWIVGGLAGVFLLVTVTMTGYVVANDGKREEGDTKVRQEIKSDLSEVRKEQTIIRQEQNTMKVDILVAIAELKMQMKNNNNE